MAPTLHAFLDDDLAAAVLRVVAGATVEQNMRFVGAGADIYRTEARRLDMGELDDARVLIVTTPESADVPARDVDIFVRDLVAEADLVVLSTLSPASGGCTTGKWPAYWADRFSSHGWRFVDLIRPALWDDPRFGPDAKEGWLVFVAPGRFDSLGASPAVAMVHPDRIGDAVAAVHAELARLRVEFDDGFRSLAHRSELDPLRRRLTATEATVEDERIRRVALDARLAATERRVLLVLERQLLAEARPPLPPPRPALRRVVDRLAGRRPAQLPAPVRPHSPSVLALFDEAAYVREHPEAADDALGHYLSVGEAMGYRPNPWFDPLFYAERHADVRNAGMNLFLHFAEHGGAEGRAASAEFDTSWYLQTYPEVRASGLNPMLHFIAVGASLGYRPAPTADVVDGPAPPAAGR